MSDEEILQELRAIRAELQKLRENQEQVVTKLLNEILKFEISSPMRENLIKTLAEKANDKSS